MTLKIIKPADPIRVDRLNVVIYGPPGLGKTSLAYTAEAPILLDFDHGAHRAIGRKDTVRVGAWAEAADINADDLVDYKTVIVDTAGRALDSLTADIIVRNPKAGRGGALTLQGYGTLKAEFVAWLKRVNGFGKDVILVAHMDEQRSGDEIVERLDVQGGSKGEIYKAADAMGRLAIRNAKLTLNFSPTEAAFGKNPGQLEPLIVPHPSVEPAFLAGVIQSIKERLNALTDEQMQAQKSLDRWRETIDAMESPEDFTKAISTAKKEPKAVQALLARAAKDAGFEFENGSFVDKRPKAKTKEVLDLPPIEEARA